MRKFVTLLLLLLFSLVNWSCILNQSDSDEPYPYEQLKKPESIAQGQVVNTNDRQEMAIKISKFTVGLEEVNKFHITYLDVNQSGDIKFQNDEAVVTINNMPIGKKGDLRFEVLKDNELKFVGEKKDLVIDKNNTTIEILILPANQKADIKVTVRVSQNQNNNNNPPQTSNDNSNAPATTLATYGDISDIVFAHCMACHFDVTSEYSELWKKPQQVIDKLTSGAMPKDPFKEGFTAEMKDKIISYVKRNIK